MLCIPISRNFFRFLEKEIKKDDIPMMDAGDSPEAPQPREMIDLEATFEKLEHELQEVRFSLRETNWMEVYVHTYSWF